MITCKICEKLKSEGEFSSIDFELGYPTICLYCKTRFPEKVKQMRLDALEQQQIAIEKQQNYELKKRDAIKHQSYDGEFDWM